VPFIGIGGTPGAGKSTLCHYLKRRLEQQYGIKALVVGMDGYHYYRSYLDKMPDPE